MSRIPDPATALTALLLCGLVGAVVVFGAVVSPAAADQHTKEEAVDMTEHANYTVNFPNPTDHHPGDQNEANGSIQYFAAGEDAFREHGAEDGAYIHYIVVDADWIDYSECDVDNTAAFGIDRGNNNSGTQNDEDLVDRMKDSEFRDDGLTIEFYEFEDIAGDPPYMAPEDAIVAQQGEGSAGGPCLTVTDEPGWYQVQGFLNATEADNGPDEEPSEDAEEAGTLSMSNYLYVCECDSEEEAREELGPPPNEEGGDDGAADDGGADDGGDDGAADDSAEDDGAEDDGAADDGAADDGSADDGAATETEGGDDGAADDGAEDDGDAPATDGEDDGDAPDGAEDGGAGDDGDEPVVEDDGEDTPESDDQPGFGAVAALVALLASALLVTRRR